ncbi:MAG: PilZ domain-containing protein [Thermoanaerobaculia bacterium]
MISFEEDRKEQRFRFVRELDATLGRVPLVLCGIAESGLGVRHATPLRLGTEASLRIAIQEPDLTVQVAAFVVWSRFMSPGEARPYHSGLRVPDPYGELRAALDRLRSLGLLLEDDAPVKRIRTDAEALRPAAPLPLKRKAPQPHLPPSVVRLVNEARSRLLSSPAELARWRERAKVTLHELGEPIPARDDVLAVWQYLDRSLELETIEKLLDE